jgi:hypothetical protein
MARIASRALRLRSWRGDRSDSFTSCWVIVEPPWAIPPELTFSKRARMVARRLTPLCWKKSSSSTARMVRRTVLGIRRSGTSWRFSAAWNVARTEPLSA